MSHAELRRAQHRIGLREARRVPAIEVEMLRQEAMRADLDLGEIFDIDRRIAGEPRPQEQRDVIAPGGERPLEEPAARLAPTLHELGVAGRIAGLEFDPARHIDACEEPGRVRAVVDVALVDVIVTRRAGAVKDVAVAGAVDRHSRPDREPPLLRFEDDAGDAALLQDRHRSKGMQHEMDVFLQRQLLAQQFEGFGI